MAFRFASCEKERRKTTNCPFHEAPPRPPNLRAFDSARVAGVELSVRKTAWDLDVARVPDVEQVRREIGRFGVCVFFPRRALRVVQPEVGQPVKRVPEVRNVFASKSF